VDDMNITEDNHKKIMMLETKLLKEFEMKDLGGIKYFLGIEVARNKNSIVLSQ
jgi:Reverse transcriptase (RNA-dependent DNA polymerase)